MTASITPSVDVDRLARRIHGERSPEQLRNSERRRRRLERWAQTMADEELALELEPESGETAVVTLAGHTPRIRIPSWEIPQPVTDYSRSAYDYLMQRTLAIHEVGHVRYTDQDAVDDVVAQVDSAHREFFHNIWNALEDGAIEEQLRHEFAVADELAVMNANFGEAGARGASTYGMADAILTACLDLAVYDSGRLASLVDPSDSSLQFADAADRSQFVSDVLPELRSAAVGVVTEGDPRARAERVLELWRRLADLLDLDELEPPQVDQGGKGDHADQDNGSGKRANDLDDLDEDSAASFVDDVSGPADADESSSDSTGDSGDNDDGGGSSSDGDGTGDEPPCGSTEDGGDSGDASDADDDGDSDTLTDDTSPDASPHGESDADDREASEGVSQDTESDVPDEPQLDSEHSSQEDSDDEASAESPSSGDAQGTTRQSGDPAGTIDRLEEKYDGLAQEQAQEVDDLSDDASREYEALRRALEQIAEEGDSPRELEISESDEFRTDAWPETKRNGKKLKRILQRQLQEEQRGRIRRGLRSGRIEPRLLTRVKRQDPRVFRKREKPDEKDYVAVLVLDRSGSMGRDVKPAEEASTALAFALSSLGIETCVIDVGGRSPRLAKPFGIDVKESLAALLNAESGGSTPLSPALRIARERLQDRDELPFVIVLTDGAPNDETQYLEELSKCPFPVLGVYLNFGGSADPSSIDQSAALFDQRRIVTRRDALDTELKRLCESVMF